MFLLNHSSQGKGNKKEGEKRKKEKGQDGDRIKGRGNKRCTLYSILQASSGSIKEYEI